MNRKAIIILLFISLLILIISIEYVNPVVKGDTESYFELANRLITLDLDDYSGERTPVFPIVIISSSFNHKTIIILQFIMIILTALMIVYIVNQFTGNNYFSIGSGLFFLLYIPNYNWARTLYPAITATFFITLTVFFLVKYLFDKSATEKKYFNFNIILSGLFSSLAALTKPLFIILPILLIIFSFFELYKNRIKDFKIYMVNAISVLSITIIFVGGWSFINYSNNGTFGLTTMGGFASTNITGNFIESASDEYKDIKNIYIKYRNEQVIKTGKHVNTIWRAKDEIMKNTDMNYSECSAYVLRVSLSAIINSPLKYLKSVGKSIIRFYRPKGGILPPFLKVIEIIERFVFLIITILFLIFPIILKKAKDNNYLSGEKIKYLLLLWSIVILSSFAQALVEYGESRYAMPVYPIIIIIGILNLSFVLQFRKTRKL